MDRYRRFPLFALALALALGGPAGAEEESTSEEAASTPNVELLDDGAEPRVLLRYQPSPGAQETLEMLMDLQQELFTGDVPMPSNKMPPMRMLLDLQVTALRENGDIEAKFVFRSMELVPKEGQEIEPLVLEAMKTAGAGLTGVEIRAVVTERGVTKEVELVEQPKSSTAVQFADQLRQQLGNASMPLPLEPVGPGARWVVHEPVKSPGMSFLQTATYELTKVQGSRFDLHLTLEQAAEDQPMELPNLPAGSKSRLLKHQGAGSGDGTYDTTRLAPVEAAVRMDATTEVEVQVMGETVVSKAKTHFEMTMKGTVQPR